MLDIGELSLENQSIIDELFKRIPKLKNTLNRQEIIQLIMLVKDFKENKIKIKKVKLRFMK